MNINLKTIDDYVNALEQTRELCDDISRDDDGNPGSMHCWMSGIAYDYWEQFLSLWSTAGTIVACASSAGFVVAFIFLLVSSLLDSQIEASLVDKVVASLCGALLIV